MDDCKHKFKRFNSFMIPARRNKMMVIEYTFECEHCGIMQHILVDKFWGWRIGIYR